MLTVSVLFLLVVIIFLFLYETSFSSEAQQEREEIRKTFDGILKYKDCNNGGESNERG